ncbi:hypothetical protein [Spirosoma litoris]
MKDQNQLSEELTALNTTEQVQIEGGIDGGCIPNPGPKLPDFPEQILY